jgi:hypothetical protein
MLAFYECCWKETANPRLLNDATRNTLGGIEMSFCMASIRMQSDSLHGGAQLTTLIDAMMGGNMVERPGSNNRPLTVVGQATVHSPLLNGVLYEPTPFDTTAF